MTQSPVNSLRQNQSFSLLMLGTYCRYPKRSECFTHAHVTRHNQTDFGSRRKLKSTLSKRN